MAAVGVPLSGGSSPNKHNVEIHAYEASWSTETNTSTVTLIARLLHTQGSPGSFGSVGSWTLGRVGMPVSASGGASYNFQGKPIPSWIDQGSTSITVPHNADGTGSVTVQAGFTSSHLGNGMATLTLPLTTIPRASKATYAGGATFEAGSPVTINTNRASGSFRRRRTTGSRWVQDRATPSSSMSAAPTRPMFGAQPGRVRVKRWRQSTAQGGIANG